MCGKPNPDVGDKVRSSRRALLDDVQNVSAVHHGEVCALPYPVNEVGEQRVPQPAERLLAREAAREFESGHTKSVSTSLGEVDDKSTLLKHAEQMVNG
jgi:hypothetical protein